MFLTYLLRELRRRARQAILIALGLALGIGLVITVTAASSGVKNAQADVLHSLYGVGTDITVTQAPAAGSGLFGGFGFGIRGSTRGRSAAGTKINQNRVTTGRYAPISATWVTSVGHLHGVAAATGALTLNDVKISLTIGSYSGGSGNVGGGGPPSGSGKFKPPATFSVSGVDLSTGALGPLSSARLAAGRTLANSDASSNVALVDSGYASQNKIKVGSTIAIGNSSGKGTGFTVVGIVATPPGTGSDVYISLARAQKLAGATGKVNTIYVAAVNSSQIGAVQKAIGTLMPKATVTSASSLASEVSGSLTSASSLANSLGRWLAIAVLAAAFLLAVLLTMTAVARRVREFGTLKALGWRSRRVVGQVMGEALVIGVIGFSRLGGNPTVTVHLTAPVTISIIGAAVLLAIIGGLIAGGFGSWRAARLRPAAALARVA